MHTQHTHLVTMDICRKYYCKVYIAGSVLSNHVTLPHGNGLKGRLIMEGCLGLLFWGDYLSPGFNFEFP